MNEHKRNEKDESEKNPLTLFEWFLRVTLLVFSALVTAALIRGLVWGWGS